MRKELAATRHWKTGFSLIPLTYSLLLMAIWLAMAIMLTILIEEVPPQIVAEKAVLCDDGSLALYVKNEWLKPDRLLAVNLYYNGSLYRGFIANNGTALAPAGAVVRIINEPPPFYYIYNRDGTVNISAAVRGLEPVEIGGWIYVQFNATLNPNDSAIIEVKLQSKTYNITTAVQHCELKTVYKH